MERRSFCNLGFWWLGASSLADASLASDIDKTPCVEQLRKTLLLELPSDTRAALLAWARQRGNFARSDFQDHSALIARDFRADRIVKVKGVHLSQTEVALLLLQDENYHAALA